MPKVVTCSNANCRASIPAEGKPVGEVIKCPKCGTNNTVLAEFGDEFEIETIEAPKAKPIHHPARQVCTNCGAVLGVRAVTCPKCGGDVRTGRTIMKVTREEKERHGLGRLLFGSKSSAPKPAAPPQAAPAPEPTPAPAAARPTAPPQRAAAAAQRPNAAPQNAAAQRPTAQPTRPVAPVQAGRPQRAPAPLATAPAKPKKSLAPLLIGVGVACVVIIVIVVLLVAR